MDLSRAQGALTRGNLQLADGRWVKGFICEPAGLTGAEDISHFGGWRAYMRHRLQGSAA